MGSPVAVIGDGTQSAVAKAGGGVYRRLRSAIEDAKRGDTILLKHGQDRLIKIDMIRLEKSDIDLTIKPYEGYHPILTLGQSSDPEAGMFRLENEVVILSGHEPLGERAPQRAAHCVAVDEHERPAIGWAGLLIIDLSCAERDRGHAILQTSLRADCT